MPSIPFSVLQYWSENWLMVWFQNWWPEAELGSLVWAHSLDNQEMISEHLDHRELTNLTITINVLLESCPIIWISSTHTEILINRITGYKFKLSDMGSTFSDVTNASLHHSNKAQICGLFCVWYLHCTITPVLWDVVSKTIQPEKIGFVLHNIIEALDSHQQCNAP